MATKNKDKLRAYNKQWYYERGGKAKRAAAGKAFKQRNREWFIELKSQLHCSRCSENHPAALDFHHPDPTEKEIKISQAIAQGTSRVKILREIEKCLVLCANCHRKEHYLLRAQEADGQQTAL